MFARALLLGMFISTSCSPGGNAAPPPRPTPQTPREAAPAAAPPSTDPLTLTVDGPAQSSPSDVDTGRFGVLWRAPILGQEGESSYTEGAIVIGNEVFVSTPNELQVFDLATGAKLRSAKIVDAHLIAAGDAPIARNDQEEVGLDKRTLRPTWRAPASNYLGAVGEYVLETPRPTPLVDELVRTTQQHPKPKRLRLRRAADGVVMWESDEQLFLSVATSPQLDGDTLFVQVYVGASPTHTAAIDVATGAVRWRAKGSLRMASGGRVVIMQDEYPLPPSSRILDAATGHVRWHAPGAWVSLHGDIAYVATADSKLTAIELSTHRVLWRHTDVSDVGGDDQWLYGMTSSRVLKIINRTSGEVVGQMQLGETPPAFRLHGPPVVRVGRWLFALGPLSAPEQRKPVVVRGCLIVTGCGSNSYAPKGAKVTIDHTTVATTDRRGCFKARAPLGLGPTRVEVAGLATELDTPFPDVVVFSGSPVTLQASWLGTGCHDSEPGGFP